MTFTFRVLSHEMYDDLFRPDEIPTGQDGPQSTKGQVYNRRTVDK
jgi:hypothetical protein